MDEILAVLDQLHKTGADFNALTQLPVKEDDAGEKAQKKVTKSKKSTPKIKEGDIPVDVHSSLLHITITNLKNGLPILNFLIKTAKVDINV